MKHFLSGVLLFLLAAVANAQGKALSADAAALRHDGHSGGKTKRTWVVVAAQNRNAVLGVPPELQDLKTPTAIPGTSEKPL